MAGYGEHDPSAQVQAMYEWGRAEVCRNAGSPVTRAAILATPRIGCKATLRGPRRAQEGR
jgi:hypothetical protein